MNPPPSSLVSALIRALDALGPVLVWLIPILILVCSAWLFLGLPLRRQERARLFLDLLDTGLKSGFTASQTVISSAQSHDLSLGPRFHLLAAYLESGYPLGRALEKVPGLVPPGVVAMVQAGEYLGDLRQILPACRRMVKDAPSQIQSVTNYQVALLLVGNPALLATVPFCAAKVFPILSEIMSGLGVRAPKAIGSYLHVGHLAFGLQIASALAIGIAILLCAGGPRFVRWIHAGWHPFLDHLFHAVPWRRKRMMRDFSALLGALLDAGVSESEAVRLAAECTNNHVFITRARRLIPRLERGESLLQAVTEIDPGGELCWRLTNAVRTQKGFGASLSGWHDALEARAYQQEQTAGQLISTALVILNGVFVAWMAWAVYDSVIAIGSAPVNFTP